MSRPRRPAAASIPHHHEHVHADEPVEELLVLAQALHERTALRMTAVPPNHQTREATNSTAELQMAYAVVCQEGDHGHARRHHVHNCASPSAFDTNRSVADWATDESAETTHRC